MSTFLYPPVSVTTLPPMGGATSANQLIEISRLEDIVALITGKTMAILKDGVMELVEKNTVNPLNTVAVPVEIVSASGQEMQFTINGDVVANISANGVSYSSIRIGDGSGRYAAIDTLNRMTVSDVEVVMELNELFVEVINIKNKLLKNLQPLQILNSSVTISDSGYTEILNAVGIDAKAMTLFDSCGFPYIIAVGEIGSESDSIVVPPGGFNGVIPINFSTGSRLSAKALSGTFDLSLNSNLYGEV